ncbi:MAG TPA: GDSL-type esterase/lipase family protein [Vicinamibacterales bacterium]|nr:GDSL-type esterase/lipase family protein [Vicinamibacterales bacterium]
MVVRVRPWLRRFALVFASLAIALGAAELVVRAFAPAWLRARMREVAVGRSLADWGSDADLPVEWDEGRPVRFVPGSQFTIRHDEYMHSVRIDEYGGRASGRAAGGSGPIVPVFGDSMAFGLGVRDAETFVSLMGASLPVRLVNLAMPGSNMLEQLDQRDALERRDARFSAAAWCVFVVFLGNDLTDVASAPDGGADDPGTVRASLSSWLFAANAALDEHWLVRRWYAVQWARALAVRRVNAAWSQPQLESVFAVMDRAVPLDRVRMGFEQAVDRLVRTSVRDHSTPLVIVVPDRFQVNEQLRRDKAALHGVEWSSYDARRPNRLVAETLAARGIAFVDASDCLEGRAGQYYVRDLHLTAAGHETIARCVGPFVAARLTGAVQ